MKTDLTSRLMARALRRRRACIGIGVGATTVRVLLVRDGRVQWKGTQGVATRGELTAALAELLAQVPRSRSRSRRAIAALGPHHAQVKALRNLPTAARSSWLNAVVRENGERYFLRSSSAMMSSRLHVGSRGTTWGAAMDGAVVDAVRAACRSAGIALVGVVPAVWVLPSSAGDEKLDWRDGEACVSLEASGGEAITIRRTRALNEGVPILPTRLSTTLHEAGSDAWEFADAYGALASQDKSSLAIALHAEGYDARGVRWRGVAITALLVAALVHLAIGPVLVARVLAERGPALTPRIIAQAAESRRLLSAMHSSSEELAELRKFREERTSVISLLGVLGNALPEDANVAGMQMRAGHGRVEINAADAAAAIEALQRSDSVTDVRLDGPVTSEVQNGTRRDRAAVRFGWKVASGSHDNAIHREGVRD